MTWDLTLVQLTKVRWVLPFIGGQINHLIDMIYRQRKLSRPKESARFITVRLFKNFKELEFVERVAECDWSSLLSMDDVNECWELFKNKFLDICDRLAPYGPVKVRGHLPEWMSDDYISIAKARDDAKKVSNRTRSPVDHFAYKRLRNSANSLSLKLKRDFIMDSIEANKGKVKKLWKILRKLIPSNSNKSSGTIEVNGKSDQMDIANDFNEMFCRIGSELAKVIPDVDLDLLPEILEIDQVFTFENISVVDVEKLLSNISVSKATGLDGINARFIKMAAKQIAEPIAYIINLSMKKSVIPLDWKVARVTPLFKAGDRTDMGNYRPISVLPITGKS